MTRKVERQPQQANKPSNLAVKPIGTKSGTPIKKRIVKKPNNKLAAGSKSKIRKSKTEKDNKVNPSDSNGVEDTIVRYRKQLEVFQLYMEDKLEEIMASDKIHKSDADRIMKKFHSAMIAEGNAMNKMIDSYGSQQDSPKKYGSDENNDESRIIEKEFQQLGDVIKQERNPVDPEENRSKSTDDAEEVIEVKKKVSKKRKLLKVTRVKTTKDNQTNHRTTRSMKANYTTQTDSTQQWDSTKPEGKTKSKKNDVPSFVKRNEYDAKLRNAKEEMSFGNKMLYNKSEKLLNILKNPSTEESSDSDMLLNSVVGTKEKIGRKKSKEPKKGKNEQSNFQNKKSVEEKERQDVLMSLMGEEGIRRANKQGTKKTPIFR